MLSAFYVCCIYSGALLTRLHHGSKYLFTMNPDQTALLLEQTDLGPYCLQYRLPKNISRFGSR